MIDINLLSFDEEWVYFLDYELDPQVMKNTKLVNQKNLKRMNSCSE